jgi:hypothetical protein
MKVPFCAREAEVVEAIATDRWPTVEADLAAHVEGCAACQDVVAVARAMHAEHAAAYQEAQGRVPSAGIVWWRAELRARQEAARVAARPMTLVHALAGACGLSAVLTMLGLVSPWVRESTTAILGAGSSALAGVELASVATILAQWGAPIGLAVCIWLVLAPVALYVVLARD